MTIANCIKVVHELLFSCLYFIAPNVVGDIEKLGMGLGTRLAIQFDQPASKTV